MVFLIVPNHIPRWGGSCTATPFRVQQYNCRTNRGSIETKRYATHFRKTATLLTNSNGRRTLNLENRDSVDQPENSKAPSVR